MCIRDSIHTSHENCEGEGGNYDEPEVRRYAGLQDHGHTYFANSLIYGEKLSNVMICGEGLIAVSYTHLCRDGKDGFTGIEKCVKGQNSALNLT